MKKAKSTLTSTRVLSILNDERKNPLTHADVIAIILKLSTTAEGHKLLTTANSSGEVLYYSLTPMQISKLAMHTRNHRLKEIGDVMLAAEKREASKAESGEKPFVTDPATQELLEEVHALQASVEELKALAGCSVCNYLRRGYYALVSFVHSWT